MHFFDRAMNQQNQNWDRFLDLECTQNPQLIKHFLDTAMDMSNNLQSFERRNIINEMGRENLEGYNAVIEFIEEHHEWLNRE